MRLARAKADAVSQLRPEAFVLGADTIVVVDNKILGKPARAKTCDAIMGITKEGAEIMSEYKGMPALDAGLLAAAQAVEHYEMSRYGTLMTWADELGLKEAVGLLDQTLQQEKKTDAALTVLAESAVNQEAQQAAE